LTAHFTAAASNYDAHRKMIYLTVATAEIILNFVLLFHYLLKGDGLIRRIEHHDLPKE
jgi:hypothetical protein